ncbi:MAG: SUF system Fe-S cluster assembly regulator [Pseudomonadota bacterium]
MIKLSKLADYAVVILAAMSESQGVRLSAGVLAETTKLPEPTVAKVLKLLAKEEVIQSIRGVNGGYVLEHAPQDIKITAVIAAMDGPIAIASCVDEAEGCCDREEHCSVKGKWTPVNAAIRNALDGVTLADMVN